MMNLSDQRLRELVVEAVKAWPKTIEPRALLEKLDAFARKVAEAECDASRENKA